MRFVNPSRGLTLKQCSLSIAIPNGILAMLVLLMAWLPAQATVVVHPDVSSIWLGRSIDYVHDADGTIGIEAMAQGAYDHKMQRNDRDVPALGYGDKKIYWLRFQLHNPSDLPLSLYLVSRFALLDYVTLYTPRGDGTFEELTLGELVAFHKRPVAYRYPVFPIELKPGMTTYYVKVKTTGSIQIPLSISSKDEFIRHETSESLFLGLLLGSTIIMLFYNIFVCLKFRSRAYLLYVAYAASYVMFSLLYHGLLLQFFFTDLEGVSFLNVLMMNFIDLIALSAIPFTIEFLELKTRSPRVYRILRYAQFFLLFNLFNALTFQFHFIVLTVMANFVVSVMLLCIGCYMVPKYHPARYYTLAWTSLLAGNMVFILASSGIIPQNVFTTWAQIIGAVMEMLLLSLALGDRVSLMQEERSAIQKKLGVVLQNRVMLVSELAHKMNNPLNYIATSVAVLRRNQAKVLRLHENISSESIEDQSLLLKTREQMVGLVAENKELLDTADDAIQKSARCIAEIRSLSGVDGFHRQRLTLKEILEKGRARIQEGMGETCLGLLHYVESPAFQDSIYANEAAFSLAFEMVFRFWFRHGKRESGHMELGALVSKANTLALTVSLQDSNGTIGKDYNTNLIPQLKDLLSPYGCDLQSSFANGRTQLIFTFHSLALETHAIDANNNARQVA